MIGRPHGILLLTGPTGSGKSTSLYAFLRYLNKESTNIITVEDLVENQIDRINQIQVNPKASRLINMGIPPYLVADSLLGVISQRLVRKLCPECKKADETTPAGMDFSGFPSRIKSTANADAEAATTRAIH